MRDYGPGIGERPFNLSREPRLVRSDLLLSFELGDDGRKVVHRQRDIIFAVQRQGALRRLLASIPSASLTSPSVTLRVPPPLGGGVFLGLTASDSSVPRA